MNATELNRQITALENLNKNQALQNQETSQALADLGINLNIGLEKIAKAMPKQTVTKIVIENRWLQPTWWNGRWWYWTGYEWI